MNDINKIKFCRKAVSIDEVREHRSLPFEANKELITSLPVYEAEDIFGDDFDLEKIFSDDIILAPAETVFILSLDGDQFLINTEGYSYMRYSICLDLDLPDF